MVTNWSFTISFEEMNYLPFHSPFSSLFFSENLFPASPLQTIWARGVYMKNGSISLNWGYFWKKEKYIYVSIISISNIWCTMTNIAFSKFLLLVKLPNLFMSEHCHRILGVMIFMRLLFSHLDIYLQGTEFEFGVHEYSI